MNFLISKKGYGGHRWHTYLGDLYGVRGGGSPPLQPPMPAPAKTSDIHVPYVPHVTGCNITGLGSSNARITELLLGEYGFNSRRATASLPAGARRGGLAQYRRPSRAARAKPLVIHVSPRRIFAAYAKSSALFPPVFFWVQSQLNKGETP